MATAHAEHDYVVVGAGSSGSVIVRRLVTSSGTRITRRYRRLPGPDGPSPAPRPTAPHTCRPSHQAPPPPRSPAAGRVGGQV
jgi:choline dehydrogenase-like flavoprotein